MTLAYFRGQCLRVTGANYSRCLAASLEQLPGDCLGQLCDGIAGFLWSGGQRAIAL